MNSISPKSHELEIKSVLDMAALPLLEKFALESHSMPPAAVYDPKDPVLRMMQLDTMQAMEMWPLLGPQLHGRQAILAENQRVKSIVDTTSANLKGVSAEDKAEFLQFISFSGLDLLTVFKTLQSEFKRQTLTFLDLGGGTGSLAASIEKCVPGLKGFIVESSFVDSILGDTKFQQIEPKRVINGDMFNLKKCAPRGCADIIISRNTLGLFAECKPQFIDSIRWALRPGGCFVIDLNFFDHSKMRAHKVEMITPSKAQKKGEYWNYLDLSWTIVESHKSHLFLFGFKGTEN